MATYVVAGAGIGTTALIGNPRRISAVSVQSSSQLALKFRRRTSKTFSPIYASVSASTAPVTKPNDLVATILSKVQLSSHIICWRFFTWGWNTPYVHCYLFSVTCHCFASLLDVKPSWNLTNILRLYFFIILWYWQEKNCNLYIFF